MKISFALCKILLSLLAFAPALHAAVSPWPGEAFTAATDLTSLNPELWKTNLSGAFWNPVTRRLWLADNSGNFTVVKEDGAGGFVKERDYTFAGDLEGITQADPSADRVYLIDERVNTIREFVITTGELNKSWDLTALIGGMADPNDAGEGIAFIPDKWLAASGFRGADGALYPKSVHGADGLGGVMLVAVQDEHRATAGYVYAVDLKKDGTFTTVGKFKTNRSESCELSFDTSNGRLYILHDVEGNLLEVTDLTSAPFGADRKFTTLEEIQVPSNSNIEGFTLTPEFKPDGTPGEGWSFFTDDDNREGALRWFKQAKFSNKAPMIGSGPSVTPNPSTVAVPMNFAAQGTDPEGDVLDFQWDFGDGTLGAGASVTKTYAAAGVYMVTVKLSDGHNLVTRLINVAVNTVAPASAVMVQKVSLAFNFVKPASDSLAVSGVLPLPAGFVPSGVVARVVIAGLDRSFTLNEKGVSADKAFSLKGKFTSGSAKFSLALKKQDLFAVLAGAGFSQTLSVTGLELPIVIVLNGQANVDHPLLNYKAKVSKGKPMSGKASK